MVVATCYEKPREKKEEAEGEDMNWRECDRKGGRKRKKESLERVGWRV